jgi:hypothetical protein
MTIATVQFIDLTTGNAGKAPFVKGGLRAYYATGPGIAETAAQVAAARAAGMYVVLYDQTPSLSLFAAGIAHVALADVEAGAGTIGAVDAAIKTRQAHNEPSTVYCSYGVLGQVKGSLSSLAGVSFGVADYSWSEAEAIALLEQNPDWGYCQFGDPASNPKTLVPGTTVTLAEANADINVANLAWAAQFMPTSTPKPVPVSQPGWVYCNKCTGLFYGPRASTSVCPAGGQHNGVASYDFTLSGLTS